MDTQTRSTYFNSFYKHVKYWGVKSLEGESCPMKDRRQEGTLSVPAQDSDT